MRPKLAALTGMVVTGALFCGLAADGAAPGKELFEKRCTGCHSADRDLEGPRLRGVYGRHAGSVPGFPYSEALQNAEFTWDANNLDRWLTDPEKFIPGNDMAFRVETASERSEIIRYLQQLSENAP